MMMIARSYSPTPSQYAAPHLTEVNFGSSESAQLRSSDGSLRGAASSLPTPFHPSLSAEDNILRRLDGVCSPWDDMEADESESDANLVDIMFAQTLFFGLNHIDGPEPSITSVGAERTSPAPVVSAAACRVESMLVSSQFGLDVDSSMASCTGGVRRRHCGKWTKEEQAFAERLIADFDQGRSLEVEKGQTLRTHLAERLRCDPLRISKRFAGANCLGRVSRCYQIPYLGMIIFDTCEAINSYLVHHF